MKGILTIIGVILIIFGIAVLGYRGFTYKTEEKVAQIGDLQVTAEKNKTVYFHPMTGGIALVGGIALLIAARRSRD